jgi:hypothetical protein
MIAELVLTILQQFQPDKLNLEALVLILQLEFFSQENITRLGAASSITIQLMSLIYTTAVSDFSIAFYIKSYARKWKKKQNWYMYVNIKAVKLSPLKVQRIRKMTRKSLS